MKMLPYKLDLNLKQMSMIQTSINYWESHEIKKKISNFFKNHDSYTICRREKDEKLDWTCEIIDNLRNKTILPDSIKNELICIIIAIGDRLIEWLKYIATKLEGSKYRQSALNHYLDNIYWTNYGTIDSIKIFKSIDINDDIIDIQFMYEEACNLCLENDVKLFWKKLTSEDKDTISWKSRWNIGDDCNVHLLVYWRWFITDKKSHLFIKSTSPNNYDDIYDFNYSAKINTFKLSVLGGYYFAVKYFFKQLNDDEKNNNLVEITELLLNEKIIKKYDRNDDEEDYNKKYIDILIYLIEKMTNLQRINLFKNYKNDILTLLITNWPWQNLYPLTLEQTFDYFTSRDYKLLILTIIDTIFDNDELREINGKSLNNVLFETWDKTPSTIKESVINDCWLFFDKFLRIKEDITFAKYVINDPDLIDKRQELLNLGKDYYYYLIIENKYSVIEDIIDNILYNDEERKNFVNNIDSQHICEHFLLKCQYKTADGYLKWQFNNENDTLNFKNSTKLNIVCCSIICDIWGWNNDRIQRCLLESDNFFKWFNYNDNDYEYLKKQLITYDKFKKILVKFLRKNEFELFDGFLKCCKFNKSEYIELKKQANEAAEIEKLEAQIRLAHRGRFSPRHWRFFNDFF